MPAKINISSHISLHTWSRRTKFFHIPDGQETTFILAISGCQQKHFWSKHPL